MASGGLMTATGVTFGDFILTLRGKITTVPSDPTNWFAVQVRKTNPNDGGTASGYLIYVRWNGSIELYKGGVGVMATASLGDVPDTWVHIKVIAQGNVITVYANNVFKFQLTDGTPFTSGYVSLLSNDSIAALFSEFLIQTATNNYSSYLESLEVSPAATALGTCKAKLHGTFALQPAATRQWYLYAIRDSLQTGSISSGDYTRTWLQDASFIIIAPSGSVLEYRLVFDANTLHNPSSLRVTVWAKMSTTSGSVRVQVMSGTGGAAYNLTPDMVISGTTNQQYQGTLSFGSQPIQTPLPDGMITLNFITAVSGTGSLQLDYVLVEFFRQGEFMGLEAYCLLNGKVVFGGLVEEQTFSFSSDRGYMVELAGTDFGWLLPKRLFTQDYASPVYLDQLIRDVLANAGSGLGYAGDTNVGSQIQQTFENEQCLQFLVRIANWAKYDFWVDFAKNFVFRARGSQGPMTRASPLQEAVNVKSMNYASSLLQMRNRIIVYYGAPSYNPSDGDSWTESTVGLWAIDTAPPGGSGVTVSYTSSGTVAPKVGSANVDLRWQNPTQQTIVAILTPLGTGNYINLRQWQNLNFWFAHTVNGTSYVFFEIRLYKKSSNSGWRRVFDTGSFPVNQWLQFGGSLGLEVPTLADDRGWSRFSSPTDNNIDAIQFRWNIQTAIGDIYLDGLAFYRDYSILQLDDPGSQNTYQLRGSYSYDKTRTDQASANVVGTGELAVRKYPARKFEAVILGDEDLQPGENITVTSASLNVGVQPYYSNELYSIRSFTHNFSKEGFTSEVKLVDALIAGLDLEDLEKNVKDEILYTDRSAKGGTGGIIR